MDTAVNHNEPSMTALAELWLIEKDLEQKARAARIDLENRMLPFIDTKEEGSTTVKTPHRKITVTTSINRRLDGTELNKIRSQIPESLLCLKTKEVLDEVRLRQLELNEPDWYRLMSRAFTSKVAKPNFKIVNLNEAT